MTKSLILIRHAKSSWGDPLQDDHDRPLNKRGRYDAPRIGRWLARQGLHPDLVLSSTAARTRETWALIAEHLAAPAPEFRKDLYLAPPNHILGLITSANADTLAIVAHNPGIGDVANTLARSAHPRFADYPTCATAVFDLTGPRAVLTDFTTPHDLP